MAPAKTRSVQMVLDDSALLDGIKTRVSVLQELAAVRNEVRTVLREVVEQQPFKTVRNKKRAPCVPPPHTTLQRFGSIRSWWSALLDRKALRALA